MFIWQVLEDILPDIDDPEPFLTLLGTLSILYNRIKWKNEINILNQHLNLQIKMEDKYFNKSVLEQFIEALNLPSEIVTYESEDEPLMSLINLSFNELMNYYLEQHMCRVSPAKITMELFDQTVAYEIDFLKLLEEGDDFQMALNHAREQKIEQSKEIKDKVS